MTTSNSPIDPAFPTAAYTPTRTGKIARLPRKIREELNTRLEDGAPGIRLIQWLNSQKEVQKILQADFHGREINEQNLTDWKHGGYRDWQRQRAMRDQIRLIAEDAAALASPNPAQTILDNLAILLAAELAVATQTLLSETTDPKQHWLHLRQSLKQLQQLRRGNAIAIRARIELERWELESAVLQRAEAKAAAIAEGDRQQAAANAPLREALNRLTMVKFFGGGEAGEQAADQYYRDMGKPEMMRQPTPDDAPPTPADSSRRSPAVPGETKPDQPKST